MEFDNDRPVRRMYKIEVWYWLLLALLSPVVNSLLLFYNDRRVWTILLLANALILPVYIFYSEVIVARFLFPGRNKPFVFYTGLVFVLLHILYFAMYSLVGNFNLSPYEEHYFSYSVNTIARESMWIAVNLSLSAAIYFIKKALEQKTMVEALEEENTGFKLRYLRAQLNPHFLFNTLNSIYSLSLQKSEKAPEVVVKLADLMRYMIYDCNQETVPLDREIEFITNFIEIEKIRHQADIRFTVEGTTAGVLIEPLLFIPFIENAFKHALENAVSRPFIYITIKADDHQVALTIINNTDIDLETQAKRIHGTSIRNSKSMLEILYPESYELDIIQTDKEEYRKSELRMKHARERLESLYPDSHTLDVILSNNAFTVSLVIKRHSLDKMYDRRR